MLKRKPLIAIVPFGISKDCCRHTMRLLNDAAKRDDCKLVLIADREAAIRGQIATGGVTPMRAVSSVRESQDANEVTHLAINQVTRRNTLTGQDDTDLAATVVQGLRHALALAREGDLDALVILGDPCRPGDRLAAMSKGLLPWMAEAWRAGTEEPVPTLGDIQTAHGIWHLSVLDAMPLCDIANSLSMELIDQAIGLLTSALSDAGFDKPNISLASLNPRRIGGRFHGTEEANFMTEPVAARQQSGVRIFGPWPLDEILADARDGAIDGIITLHTGQARILRTFLNMERAPQIIAGLGVPCVRALWERPPGKPADLDAELAEAQQSLNLARLLVKDSNPAFRFRGENRSGNAPKR